MKMLIYKKVTPLIRTLNINKIEDFLNLETLEEKDEKIKLIDNLYKKKIVNIELSQINFPKNLHTYLSLSDAKKNTLKLNPSPEEIAREIKRGDVIKPIKLLKVNGKYYIHDGINRLWGYKILSIKSIKCILINHEK